MRKVLFWSVLCYWTVAFSGGAGPLDEPFRYPIYLGAMGGFGSTTWEGLVPAANNQNLAISISAPTWVTEGGGIWGFFAGYELSPFFAIEANYAHYPDAKVVFAEDSLFAFENDGRTLLRTSTETASVQAKIMLIIPYTTIRAFSSAGVARVQRADDINCGRRISPTFGIGLNYNFFPHVMGELGANYTAGYGESELNPVKDYVPFLYSVFLKLGVRF